MAWGVARWGEELEFAMPATKKEPHPGWEQGQGGPVYRGASMLTVGKGATLRWVKGPEETQGHLRPGLGTGTGALIG